MVYALQERESPVFRVVSEPKSTLVYVSSRIDQATRSKVIMVAQQLGYAFNSVALHNLERVEIPGNSVVVANVHVEPHRTFVRFAVHARKSRGVLFLDENPADLRKIEVHAKDLRAMHGFLRVGSVFDPVKHLMVLVSHMR